MRDRNGATVDRRRREGGACSKPFWLSHQLRGDSEKLGHAHEDDPRLVTSILKGLTKQRGEGEWKLDAMEIGVHVDEDAVDFDNPPTELEVHHDNISGAMLDQ